MMKPITASKPIAFLFLLGVFFTSCEQSTVPVTTTIENTVAEPYTPHWESLKQHRAAPEWFEDAKFGIYFHWGVYSVPAFGNEWYPNKMYKPGTAEFEHHKNTYGDQAKFGYHDFVPMFKAEQFDAAEWADLFQNSGARFAGPVAQHHDGFAMWKSKVNPWNSAEKGPRKDITGMIADELRKRDIKLITTFHHARNLQRNRDNPRNYQAFDSHFHYDPDYHTSTTDPVLGKLYGMIDPTRFDQYWYDQVIEVVDAYGPDIIWFDTWFNIIDQQKVKEMCSYYFNDAAADGREVVIAYKQADLPKEVGVKDIEQGGRRELGELPWMTDITLSHQSWCYVEGQTYKTADLVLRNMIDVISKNGVVLLNISPKADGSIPQEQREVLGEIGDWLAKFGEAVYNTRPYDIYGFGNAVAGAGEFGGQSATVKYTSEDVRLTRSKDGKTIYMLLLGKPEAGAVINYHNLSHHRYHPAGKIKRITLLGTDIEVPFNDKGYQQFEVTIPNAPMNDLVT
ncbi:MAG: alpha-L-fucosidase, partial [Bacteroidota bacterium]